MNKIPYAERAAVIGQVMLSGDVLCDELEPTHASDGSFTTRWLRVVNDSPETSEHGAYKAGNILTLTAGVSDKDVSPAADPLAEAQAAHRPHSLIASQRTWQLQATIPGVCQAWGYAYENGEFNR